MLYRAITRSIQSIDLLYNISRKQKKNAMASEVIRLSTFNTYSRDATPSALELARAGFAYKGSLREIECSSCGWRTARLNITFEEIVRNHGRMYPTCAFVKGESFANVKWSADSETNFLDFLKRNNLRHCTNKTNCNEIRKKGGCHKRLKRNNEFNQTQKFFANKSIGYVNFSTRNQRNHNQGRSAALEEVLIPIVNEAASRVGEEIIQSQLSQSHDMTEESQAAPTMTATAHSVEVHQNQQEESANQTNMAVMAPMASLEVSASQASSSSSSNQAQSPRPNNGAGEMGPGPTYSDLGIVTEMPKRPEYALKPKRLETFLSWPRDHHLRPEELSEAGFYYAGYGDCSRCFFCGGGLRNWEDEDDVWVEHARWFPKCAYIRGKLGNNFIEIVQDLSKELEQISLKTVTDRLGHSIFLDTPESSFKNDPAVRSVLELGYNENDVVEVVSLLKQQAIPLSADVILEKLKQEMKNKSCRYTASQLRTIINTQVNEASMNELKERNNQLRQQTVCKICLDRDVSVVFLPCGHLVSCTECYIAMRDCPVCRTIIKGTVRAFIN